MVRPRQHRVILGVGELPWAGELRTGFFQVLRSGIPYSSLLRRKRPETASAAPLPSGKIQSPLSLRYLHHGHPIEFTEGQFGRRRYGTTAPHRWAG